MQRHKNQPLSNWARDGQGQTFMNMHTCAEYGNANRYK